MADVAEQSLALEMLSKRLRGPLQRFFEKRLGRNDRQEVEDLVQEVFVRLAAEGRLESVRGVEAYLFRIASNLLKDRGRVRLSHQVHAHEPYVEALHAEAAQTLSPERELIGCEALERLIAALLGLPELTRTVWALYHFEDLPHTEIASRLGIAKSTVEKHMNRANAHLLKRARRKL